MKMYENVSDIKLTLDMLLLLEVTFVSPDGPIGHTYSLQSSPPLVLFFRFRVNCDFFGVCQIGKHKECMSTIIVAEHVAYCSSVNNHLNFGSKRQRLKAQRVLRLAFLLNHVTAQQFLEVRAQMASQQRFARRNT